MAVVKSMMPPGTSMSNPYKWRQWAQLELTDEGKGKIQWKPHDATGRPRLTSIDEAREWMKDVPKNATINETFVKSRLKKRKESIWINRIKKKMKPESFSPAKNTCKIYLEELTMNPDEPLGVTEKPYHKTEVSVMIA